MSIKEKSRRGRVFLFLKFKFIKKNFLKSFFYFQNKKLVESFLS